MAYKPILFNTEMVQAIMAGWKTQTRRLMKLKYKENEAGFQILTNTHDGSFAYAEYYDEDENPTRLITPPCMPGSILWVRETWGKLTECNVFPPYEPDEERFIYRADSGDPDHFQAKWHPSIHMPKEAARIFLRVKDVRVERLRDITEEQAEKEGCSAWYFNITSGIFGNDDDPDEGTAVEDFQRVWDSTIKPADLDKYGWAADPWVWVIEFECCEKPEGWPEQEVEQ